MSKNNYKPVRRYSKALKYLAEEQYLRIQSLCSIETSYGDFKKDWNNYSSSLVPDTFCYGFDYCRYGFVCQKGMDLLNPMYGAEKQLNLKKDNKDESSSFLTTNSFLIDCIIPEQSWLYAYEHRRLIMDIFNNEEYSAYLKAKKAYMSFDLTLKEDSGKYSFVRQLIIPSYDANTGLVIRYIAHNYIISDSIYAPYNSYIVIPNGHDKNIKNAIKETKEQIFESFKETSKSGIETSNSVFNFSGVELDIIKRQCNKESSEDISRKKKWPIYSYNLKGVDNELITCVEESLSEAVNDNVKLQDLLLKKSGVESVQLEDFNLTIIYKGKTHQIEAKKTYQILRKHRQEINKKVKACFPFLFDSIPCNPHSITQLFQQYFFKI